MGFDETLAWAKGKKGALPTVEPEPAKTSYWWIVAVFLVIIALAIAAWWIFSRNTKGSKPDILPYLVDDQYRVQPV